MYHLVYMMYDICYCAFLQIWADHRKHEEPWYEDSIASKECFGASSSHTNGSVEIETSFELWFWSLYFSSSGYKRLKFSFANRPKLHLCLIFSIYFVSVQNICYWVFFFFLKKSKIPCGTCDCLPSYPYKSYEVRFQIFGDGLLSLHGENCMCIPIIYDYYSFGGSCKGRSFRWVLVFIIYLKIST